MSSPGKSSAPFVSQPQGKAPIQTLAIVPTKARTFSLLSEDESAEQRFRKPQSTKDADTPLPEWAYEEFGERIRRIHQHYHPSLPPFVEVSRSIRIFLRVRVILAKPDGSYPPANQLEDLTAYVTTRWWDTTCIYWTLDKGESRIIVSPKVHGIRQIYRRWNDTMGGFDLVPVAYGHIRNKRRKELFRNSSSEDESSERARPRARTTAATSGNQSHEHRVPTVMTTSAMRPRESGVLSTATAPTMQQQNRAPSFLTGANSLPVGAKERPGLDAGSNEKVGRLAKTYALDKNKNSVVSSSEKAVITQAGISDAAANISTISSDTRSTVQTVSTSQAETRANRQDDSREEEDPQSTLPRLQESGSTRANMPSPNSIRESISTPASMPPPGIPHPFADPNHMPPLPSSIPNQMPPQKKSNPTPTQTPPQVTSAAYQTPTQTPPQNHSASFYPPSVPTQPLGYPPGPFPMHHPPPAPYQQMMPVQIPSSNFQTPQYPPQQNLQAPLFHPLHYHHQTPQSSWRQSSSAATAQFPPTSTVNQPYYFPIPRQHPTSCLPATTQSASQHQQHQHQNDELRNVQVCMPPPPLSLSLAHTQTTGTQTRNPTPSAPRLRGAQPALRHLSNGAGGAGEGD